MQGRSPEQFGLGFDQLMELLNVSGVLTGGLTIFNVITAYGKLVLAEMTAEATITMDSSPLVRRTSPEPGCQRKLTATLMQKTGNWQLLNCLRLALLHAGIDVDVPKDGPIDGAKTQWHIVEGGASVSQAGATGSNTAIVEWVGTGPRIQDAGTYAGTPGIVTGGTAVSDFSQPTTSEHGIVEIMIEGCARRNDLNGWAVPVMKTAKVQLTFAVKPPNLKEDVLNALEAGAALLSGPMVLLTTVPVEMFLRSRWFASPVFTIPVKDWQACNTGWSGKMSFERTRHWSQTESGPDTYGGTWTKSETIDQDWRQEWQLAGSQHNDPAGGIAVDATWTALIKNRQVGTQYVPRETQCPPSWQNMAGQDEGQVQVIIGFMQETADTQTYYIGADVPSGPFKPDAVKWSTGGGCPGEVSGGSKPIDVTSFGASGPVDPKDPNHLFGIKRTVDPYGTDEIVKWDLHVCGRVKDVCGQQN